jgi:hypothetical protein
MQQTHFAGRGEAEPALSGKAEKTLHLLRHILAAATHVIHYDLWWNPAVEDQATDRTYRIGQTRNITVHRLITIGTFEEKIDEMLAAKKELAALVAGAGEKWLTELSDRELRELFSLSRGSSPSALSQR